MENFDIESLPVKIEYVGETVRDGEWKCDQWRVSLSNKNGFWSTDYFTGLGLRKLKKGSLPASVHKLKKGTLAYESWERSSLVPTKPSIADVMYSLVLDASAADSNFHDWCADFGMSDDSIKALNTYKQCLDIDTALKKYFDRDTLQAIKNAVQDM